MIEDRVAGPLDVELLDRQPEPFTHRFNPGKTLLAARYISFVPAILGRKLLQLRYDGSCIQPLARDITRQNRDAEPPLNPPAEGVVVIR